MLVVTERLTESKRTMVLLVWSFGPYKVWPKIPFFLNPSSSNWCSRIDRRFNHPLLLDEEAALIESKQQKQNIIFKNPLTKSRSIEISGDEIFSMRSEIMSNEGLTLVGDLMAVKKPLSTTEFRRKGVRKTNSGGSAKAFPKKTSYRPQRSKSDCSSTVSLANRERIARLSATGNLDASMTSLYSQITEDESVGSYSLDNDDNDDSIDSRPIDKVRSQVARINKDVDNHKKSDASLPRTSSDRSERDAVSPHSAGSRRPSSPHSVGRRHPSPHSGKRPPSPHANGGRRPSSPHSVGKRPPSPHSLGGKRNSSPHSTGGKRNTDPLDNQKSRMARRRSNSRSEETEIIFGDLPLDNQKSRSAPKRTSSRSSEKSEVDLLNPSPPPRKESPHTTGRKKSSRSTDGSGKTSASPPSLTDSPYARGRKKSASLRSMPDYSQKSSSSMSLTSPPMTGRQRSKRSLKGDDTSVFTSPSVSVRSKSKKSLVKQDNGDDGDSSMRKERRKNRARSKSKSRTGGSKSRTSSRKRSDGKRQSRRSRTPSKDEFFESDLDTSERRKGTPVSEEEIMELVNKTKDASLKTEENESETKDKRAMRRSKSPGAFRPEGLTKSNSDNVRRPRSTSFGNLEKKRVPRRLSMDAQTHSTLDHDEKKEKRTRNPPRRSKSNNIGIDKSGLDSFFKNTSSVTGDRRKKAMSGSRSVKSYNVPASKSVATTRSTKSRRRRKGPQSNRSLKYLGGGTEHLEQLRDPDADLSGHRSFDEDDLDVDSDNDSYDDNRSDELDLDLATARDNFARQNANEKLQMHLTKTDELLYSVFPKHVANALRNGQKVEPENHDLVTIFFSDIVGFTDISAKLDPLKISDMLDRLYNSFDALSDYHDVFKVET